MKFQYLLFISIVFWAKLAISQNQVHTTVPSNPSFSILDFEPTSVLQPGSVSELRTNILNSFDAEGRLRPNVGLEFAPYWLKSRDSLTEEQYFSPTIAQTIKQTLQLSAATVYDTALMNNKLGIGFRFLLSQGRPSANSNNLRVMLKENLTYKSVIANARGQVGESINTKEEAVEFIIKNLRRSPNGEASVEKILQISKLNIDKFGSSDSEIKDFIEIIQNEFDNTDLAKKKFDADLKRKGLIVELGGASSFQAVSGKHEELQRLGVWLSASEHLNNDNQWTFTARYYLSQLDSTASSFDAGLTYLKKMDKFNLSIEAVARWYEIEFDDINISGQEIRRVEDDFTYRIAANLNYSFNDFIFINASFGKAFDSPLIGEAGFFSIIGINYNLFKTHKVQVEGIN